MHALTLSYVFGIFTEHTRVKLYLLGCLQSTTFKQAFSVTSLLSWHLWRHWVDNDKQNIWELNTEFRRSSKLDKWPSKQGWVRGMHNILEIGTFRKEQNLINYDTSLIPRSTYFHDGYMHLMTDSVFNYNQPLWFFFSDAI